VTPRKQAFFHEEEEFNPVVSFTPEQSHFKSQPDKDHPPEGPSNYKLMSPGLDIFFK
jgi:hypothetical protein